MKLSDLSKIVQKSKRRVGRGHGSGRVKTAGRGTKGQNARGRVKIGYEGGQLPLIKRLPLLRGKAKNASRKEAAITITIGKLRAFKEGDKVNLAELKKLGVIDTSVYRVKVVAGKGEIPHNLQVEVACSQGARKIIEKSGGKVL